MAVPTCEDEPGPLTVGAAALGKMLGVSKRTVWTRHAGGEIPAPLKLGNRTLWSVDEVKEWIAAGMPDRAQWERMKGG